MDVDKDREFIIANETLDHHGKLKQNVKDVVSMPTKHKEILTPSDMSQIRVNLIILRFRVWFDLAIYYFTRGLEFHDQLKPNSFEFLKDENDCVYVVLSHETKQKKPIQGG